MSVPTFRLEIFESREELEVTKSDLRQLTGYYWSQNYDVSPKLEIWGNARYTHDRKGINFSQGFTSQCQTACPEVFALIFNGLDPQIGARTTTTFQNVSGGAGLNYKPSDDLMLYGKVVTGFKAGGFNSIASTVDRLPFDEEKTIGYELGLKSDLLRHRLRLGTPIRKGRQRTPRPCFAAIVSIWVAAK